MNTLLRLLPLLLTKKRSWLVLAILAYGGYQYGNALPLMDFGIDQLWKEPRDVLVDRVADARDAQSEAVHEFKSAMQEFQAVTGFNGGDLEASFERLNAAYQRSVSSADDIGRRVDKVVNASNGLLEEWREELAQYHDAAIRRRAEVQFDQTRQRARDLIAAMRNAEQKAAPVLAVFKDQVLYIKHNLNMQAVHSLQGQTEQIQNDVSALIAEMEQSIDVANAFINDLAST